MKEQLRLDYFLSLGLKLAKKDKYTLWNREYVISGADNAAVFSEDDIDNKERFITSFAQRTNTGEQPCGDDVPVIVAFNDEECRYYFARDITGWASGGGDYDIESWKPDLAALIKMQNEHDANQAQTKKTVVDAVNDYETRAFYGLNGAYEFICECDISGDLLVVTSNTQANQNLEIICTKVEFLNCVEEMSYHAGAFEFSAYLNTFKMPLTINNAIYAQYIEEDEKGNVKVTKPVPFVDFGAVSKAAEKAMAELGATLTTTPISREQLTYTPEMKSINATPEAGMLCCVSCRDGDNNMFEFKFELDCEYVCVNERGFAEIIDKGNFISFMPPVISELESAKIKQVDEVYECGINAGFDVNKTYIRTIQDDGHLAEIILPLKSKWVIT